MNAFELQRRFVLFPKEELLKLSSNVKREGIPLWMYWAEFVRHWLREGKSEVTLGNVRDALRFVVHDLRLVTVEACNTPDILREALFDAKERRNWTSVTFNTYRKNLNTYFLWLERMEHIEENKLWKIAKCKEEINEQYTLDEGHIKSLLGHMKTRRQSRLERWRNDLFMGILVVTGARPIEMLGLQCRDIKETRDGGYQVVIRGRKQKGRNRYYRMPSWVRDSYEMYIRIRQNLGRDEPGLFVSSSKRTGWTNVGMRALFKKLSKELGFRVNAYAIRRYVATKLDTEGVDIKDIMNHLGHTRLSTTQKYIERSGVLTNRGVAVLEKIVLSV